MTGGNIPHRRQPGKSGPSPFRFGSALEERLHGRPCGADIVRVEADDDLRKEAGGGLSEGTCANPLGVIGYPSGIIDPNRDGDRTAAKAACPGRLAIRLIQPSDPRNPTGKTQDIPGVQFVDRLGGRVRHGSG